jgi:threonine dehydrogenase-like Zn-dependent dehydrogenase
MGKVRVTIEHVEVNAEAGRVSVTGTVNDSPAAAVFRLITKGLTIEGYEKMPSDKREMLLAKELAKSQSERKPVPGKHYIEIAEVEHGTKVKSKTKSPA